MSATLVPAGPATGPGEGAAWTATGPADAPAIVFVHGTRTNRAQWNGQVRRLAGDFRCVALDLPGHGALVDEPFTLAGAADQVADTIAAAVPSGRAVVVGTSLGGFVALETALRHPDRVAGLVLAACSADPVGPARLPFRVYAFVLGRFPVRLLDAVNRRFFRVVYGRETGGAISAGGLARAGGAQSIHALLDRQRFRERLFDLWVPVLVINGAFDLLFAPGGDAWAATCRRGRHVLLRGAGHLLDLDRPAGFAAHVRRFVREVASGG